jgi:FkbM family methyltransferase
MMPSPRRLFRRFVVGGGAIQQGLSNLSTDLRLLMRGSRNGVVLRQKHLDGFQMVVRSDEEVGREVYYKGVFEGEETAFLKSVVGKSSVCFDVGANISYYSLLFASLIPQGSVHSFEPIPLNYHILCASSLLNGFSNVHANLCAVGDREGEAEFVISTDSAYSSLVDTGRKPAAKTIAVPITTLDTYCDKNNVGKIDVLKVDVEGAEGKVLSGAEQIMRDPKSRPRTVMLELYEPMLAQYGTSVENISRKMKCFGYEAFVLSNRHLVPFERELHGHLYNVVFIHD